MYTYIYIYREREREIDRPLSATRSSAGGGVSRTPSGAGGSLPLAGGPHLSHDNAGCGDLESGCGARLSGSQSRAGAAAGFRGLCVRRAIDCRARRAAVTRTPHGKGERRDRGKRAYSASRVAKDSGEGLSDCRVIAMRASLG